MVEIRLVMEAAKHCHRASLANALVGSRPDGAGYMAGIDTAGCPV